MHRSLTSVIGRREIYLKEVVSTNDYAVDLITKKNPIEGTVVFADFQTGGKGQYGRVWHSDPSENLTLSVILEPRFLKLQDQFMLNILASLSIAQQLQTGRYPHPEFCGGWKNPSYHHGYGD